MYAEVHQELIPYVHIQWYQSKNINAIFDPFSIIVLLPKGGLRPLSTYVPEWWIVARQLCNVPHSQGKLHPLIESPSVLSLLFCPNHSTSSAVRPSCPPCHIIFWSQITKFWQLQFDFPLHSTVYVHKPPNLTTLSRFSEDQQNGNCGKRLLFQQRIRASLKCGSTRTITWQPLREIST